MFFNLFLSMIFCGCCFLICKHEASILLEMFGKAASSLPLHIVGIQEAQCWRCTDLALCFQSGKAGRFRQMQPQRPVYAPGNGFQTF